MEPNTSIANHNPSLSELLGKTIFDIYIPSRPTDINVKVRFPNDADWIVRNKARRYIANGDAIKPAPTASADLKLYNSIRVDGPAEIDGDTASVVVTQLMRCSIPYISRLDNGNWEIKVSSLAGDFAVELQTPLVREMNRYNSLATTSTRHQNGLSISVHLGPASDLFQSLFVGGEMVTTNIPNPEPPGGLNEPQPDEFLSYHISGPNDIPIIYRSAIVQALKDELERRIENPGYGKSDSDFS